MVCEGFQHSFTFEQETASYTGIEVIEADRILFAFLEHF